MISSIDKEIELMIKKYAISPSTWEIGDYLRRLKLHLLDYKPKGWSAYIYGSTFHGLATEDDITDICIINDCSSSVTTPQPIITHDSVNFEGLNISGNTDVIEVESLASHLKSMHGNGSLFTVSSYPQAPVPFITTSEPRFNTKFNITFYNTLDVERSNLIVEYLSLDRRIKPFLFALRRFIKKRKINEEKNGFPTSNVFIMMGLYFLMFVQEPPVIPCIHAMADKISCNYPVCRSKRKRRAQGFDVTYHDCARIDRIAEYDPLLKVNTINLYGTPWVSKNKKSAGDLLLEAFRWFSYTATILEPKSIKSKEPPVLQPEWEHDFMVFADIFDPGLNIAASCTVTGAKFINEEFFNAYVKLKEGDSFEKVLNASSSVLTPIVIEPNNYTRDPK